MDDAALAQFKGTLIFIADELAKRQQPSHATGAGSSSSGVAPTVNFVSSRTRSKSRSQASTIFSISDDQVQQICDFLCKPDGPLLFESKSAAPVSHWSRSCKHFSTVLKVQMPLFKSHARIRDEFVSERIDNFSQHADRNAHDINLKGFEATIRKEKSFLFCSNSAMHPRHFEILSAALGAGSMRSLEVLDLSRASTPNDGEPAFGCSSGFLGAALSSFVRASQQAAFAPNLRKLYLSFTGVTDAGFTMLIQAAENPGVLASLQKLDLSDNDISGDGEWPASMAKVSLPSLCMLNLEGNDIQNEAIVNMMKAVSNPGVLTTLERLGLKGNGYSDDGLNAITAALSDGALPSLKQLTTNAFDCDVMYECNPQVRNALKIAMTTRDITPRRMMRGVFPAVFEAWASSLDVCETHYDTDDATTDAHHDYFEGNQQHQICSDPWATDEEDMEDMEFEHEIVGDP